MRNHANHGNYGRDRGFTLIELLVVITIIGILVGLLLPAVNSARESGRRAQCQNNLRQIGTASLAHEEAHGFFPTGGWGWYWVGDPDCGFGESQPGGWVYNILPHTDMNAVHDLGHYGNNSQKQQAVIQMVGTPWTIVNCPTRRRPSVFPMNWGTNLIANNAGTTNAPSSGYSVARTDYAVLVGAVQSDEQGGGPSNNSVSAQQSYFGGRVITVANGTAVQATSACFTYYTGVSFERSTIRRDDITDGLTDTILVGEKSLDLDKYGTGGSGADNENMYVGMDNDIGRTTYRAPMRDRWEPGVSGDTFAFGSAHPTSCNFVACDGHVFTVSYTVDATTFYDLGTRAGGDVVDLTKL